MSETSDILDRFRKVHLERLALEKTARELKDEEAALLVQASDLIERETDDPQGAVRSHGYTYSPYKQRVGIITDPDAYEAWAQANAPDLLELKPRKQDLTDEIEQRLENGEPLPPGTSYIERPKLSMKKA